MTGLNGRSCGRDLTATAYDPRVIVPLNAQRVIAAGERILAEYELPPELRKAVEANFVRLCAELAHEPKHEPKPPKRSRAKP